MQHILTHKVFSGILISLINHFGSREKEKPVRIHRAFLSPGSQMIGITNARTSAKSDAKREDKRNGEGLHYGAKRPDLRDG